MLRRRFFALSILFLFIGPALVIAQIDACPEIVRAALATANQICDTTGRNQACYGNVKLEAEPQADITTFQFDKPGDLVDVAQVKTLRLSPLDQTDDSWGVALMRIQANLPDTLPGQNVTFLLFGDVEIQNAGQPDIEQTAVEVTAIKAVIVYESPSSSSRILAGMIANEKAIADGQSADHLWLRVQLPDDASEHGWIHRDNIAGGGFDQLPLIGQLEPTGEELTAFKPMQAFYFKSGFRDRPCVEAPDSGILIQAPEHAGPILLHVNGVDVTLGSTAYFQAQPSGDMTISVIEGAALVEADGEVRAVPAGTQVTVPMDQNLGISGLPSQTQAYNTISLQTLPIRNLETEIVIAPALTPNALAHLNEPMPGVWQQISNAIRNCPDGTSIHDLWQPEEITISDVNDNGFSVHNAAYVIQFTKSASGFTYSGQLNYLDHILVTYEYKVLSPDHIVGQLTYLQDNCSYSVSREIVFQRPDLS